MQKFFRIHVTPDLQGTPMIKGNLDKNGNIEGATEKVIVSPPIQWFPMSYSKIVKKIFDDKNKYTGKFDFCKADEQGAEVIEVHYVPGCPSLDRKWQEDNGFSLKRSDPIELLDAEAEIGREYLANTIYDFDLTKEDPLFITFLKNHDINGSNPNRDKNTRILFIEKDGEESVSKKKKDFAKEKVLFKMKSELLEGDDLVGVLTHVFDLSVSYDLDTRRDMLVEMLESQGEKFITSVEKAKTKILNQTEFLFKDGLISVLDKQIVSNDDKKPIHPHKFNSDKPSVVAQELAEFSVKTEKNYLSWIEIEKKLLQTT